MKSRLMLGGFLSSVLGMIVNPSIAGEVKCELQPLDVDAVVSARVIGEGGHWGYSVGAEFATTELVLESKQDGVAHYRVNDDGQWLEVIEDYAVPNSSRDGRQQLLAFPLSVSARWQDAYSEPGQVAGPFGTYRYQYKETATNVVVGVESIRIGVGSIPAFRIERVASWEKSSPQSADMVGYKFHKNGTVTGVDKITSWYSPQLGRVVLRSRNTMHPSLAQSVAPDTRAAHTRVTELVYYRGPDGCELRGEPTQARLENPDRPTIGYRLYFNDSWEFRMSRDWHVPLISAPAR